MRVYEQRTYRVILFVATIVAIVLSAQPASADELTFSFDPTNTFSGTAPAGSLTADFTQVAGGVQLVITSNLGPGENLDPGKALYFNIDPADTVTDLSFTLTANTGFSEAATVMTGEDFFKPDGDGLMDILFTYSPSTKAFTGGESQTYLITSSSDADLSAADFDFSSTCDTGCGTGGHFAAVHVQNTPNGGSGSAFVGGTPTPSGVPEPGSMTLLGTGVGLAAVIRRKKPLR